MKIHVSLVVTGYKNKTANVTLIKLFWSIVNDVTTEFFTLTNLENTREHSRSHVLSSHHNRVDVLT